jgi:cytochrome oxidase Cu insertion factor (SCO1/SenC/PrrC family)
VSTGKSLAAALVAGIAIAAAACDRSEPAAPTSSSGPIEVGAAAPGFSLPSASGGEVSLASFAGKRPVLLYFSMGPG